jgi:hypothetical protein
MQRTADFQDQIVHTCLSEAAGVVDNAAAFDALELVHADSAEVAARLARWLGYVTSPDTLIRRQRAEPTAHSLNTRGERSQLTRD